MFPFIRLPGSNFLPNRALNSAILTHMAWLGIFSTVVPNSYAAARIRTHVNRVAPAWGLADGLPTELRGRGRSGTEAGVSGRSGTWLTLIPASGAY